VSTRILNRAADDTYLLNERTNDAGIINKCLKYAMFGRLALLAICIFTVSLKT
jgi:hypothetical protein